MHVESKARPKSTSVSIPKIGLEKERKKGVENEEPA